MLGVSPAAISGAVRHLIGVGLVERARELGERRDTYRLLDDVWFESFGRADDRFARLAATLTAGMNAVGPGRLRPGDWRTPGASSSSCEASPPGS
jgi:hypothetical protein